MKYVTKQFEARSWQRFINYVLRRSSDALLILRDRKGEQPYTDLVREFLPAKAPMTTLVREISWPTRVEHGLERFGIQTLGDLVAKSKNDLLELGNFGERSLQVVTEVLRDYGLSLRVPEGDKDPLYTCHVAGIDRTA